MRYKRGDLVIVWRADDDSDHQIGVVIETFYAASKKISLPYVKILCNGSIQDEIEAYVVGIDEYSRDK